MFSLHRKTKKKQKHNLFNKISEVKVITEQNDFWSAVTTVEVKQSFEGFWPEEKNSKNVLSSFLRTHTAGQKKCLEMWWQKWSMEACQIVQQNLVFYIFSRLITAWDVSNITWFQKQDELIERASRQWLLNSFIRGNAKEDDGKREEEKVDLTIHWPDSARAIQHVSDDQFSTCALFSSSLSLLWCSAFFHLVWWWERIQPHK